VHGEFYKLVGLLKHLEYRNTDGVWRHPGRTAIFVGDLIDRGPGQVATLDVVRSMVEGGAARCIMGNHEFNAIAWFTRHPEEPEMFLRPHSEKNTEQHAAFLKEMRHGPRHAEWVAWFKTLPLWLDLGGLRVVHACWHRESMDRLQPLMGAGNTLTDELIVLGSRKGHWAYEAIEVVCKGPEVPLPEGISFADKEGKIRHEVRVRWWQEDLSTYRKAAIGPPGDLAMIPDAPLPQKWLKSFRALSQASGNEGEGAAPVLFGHYWFTGAPKVISPRFACLDYSVARGGPLVAYRWDGEAELSTDKLAWIS